LPIEFRFTIDGQSVSLKDQVTHKRPAAVETGFGYCYPPAPWEVSRHWPSGLTDGGLGMYLATTSAIRASVSASQVLSGS